MIKKDVLIQLVSQGLSSRKIAVHLSVCQATIKHWLKKYGLKTQHNGPGHIYNVAQCIVCGRSTKSQRKLCPTHYQRLRRYRTKKRAVEILGGKCIKCGWSGRLAGYEFHHIGGDKSFEIGNVRGKRWSSIRKELAKCELWCATCHRIFHSKDDEDLMESLNQVYKGDPLD
jgi:hypothetical protein